MARLLVGPVQDLGHPFGENSRDIPTRHEIGGHDVYAFRTPWLERDLRGAPLHVTPEGGPFEAVVVWDPFWLSRDQLKVVHRIASELDVPLVGLFGDWLAGWHDNGYGYKTDACLNFVDALVIDPVGAASMRTLPPMTNERSPARRPMAEVANFLTFGRLPSMGEDLEAVRGLANDPYQNSLARDIDVTFVGYWHADTQIYRPIMLEQAREFCEEHGLEFYHGRNVSKGNMEDALLRTKVCLNASLGCQLNCRVYEAAATGAALLTDAWNYQAETIGAWAEFWEHPRDVKHKLEYLLLHPDADDIRANMARRGAEWALGHTPYMTWERLLDASASLIEEARPNMEARKALRYAGHGV